VNRDLVFLGLFWLALTIVGEIAAATIDIYPTPVSDKGEEIDWAFRFLVYPAVPVFALVVAVLVYTYIRHGRNDFPEEDGPPMKGQGAVPVAWFAITSALTLFVIVFPGLTGVQRLFFDDPEPDLVVEVQGVQWAWLYKYPGHDVQTLNELVLPVDRQVRFEITSTDVLHSFWIPAFLMKIDAVPGLTTTMQLEPTETGSFETDPLMRVQCAELCGLSHSRMAHPVTVLEPDEFEAWLAENAEEPNDGGDGSDGGGDAEAQQVDIVSKDSTFDLDEISVKAGSPVLVVFDNQDEGVFHNWALYESQAAADEGGDPMATSELEKGPVVQEIDVDANEAGTYFFRCDAHPTTMFGDYIVE
jgi:cytochrome c oxidase subunit 2